MTNPTPTKTGTPAGTAAFCASCGSPLSPGARFCHRCGTPSGQGPGPKAGAAAPAASGGLAGVLPWGVAFVALLALVAMVAGQNFGVAGGSRIDGSANALPTPAIDGPGLGAAPFAGGAGPGGPAPNIANLSPRERADRLYVRVIAYDEAGLTDSVLVFTPMALAAHELLDRSEIDIDTRYHMGRIAAAASIGDYAKAQADTILAEQPTHLLGLMLAQRAAEKLNDSAGMVEFDRRLVRAAEAELARRLPEYDQHMAEINLALERARAAQ